MPGRGHARGPTDVVRGPSRCFSEAEDDGERRARAAAGAREEAPGVAAGGRGLEQPAGEGVPGGRGALELHALADRGDVAAAHAGGRAETVPAGAAPGGTGRGTGVRGTGHDRVLPLSAGKIATLDVRGCDWCDWSDAPGGMDGCYRSV